MAIIHMIKKITLMAVWYLFLSPDDKLPAPTDHNAGQPAVALYVFGDSLFDDGMSLYLELTGKAAKAWPYGETYFNKPVGRFSDGRIIPDFIAQFAGLPFPKPYLLPGLDSYANGIDFAYAAACVLPDIRNGTINLSTQLDMFQEMVVKMKQQMGEAAANVVVSRAVYLFNIGGNVYLQLFQNNVGKLPLSHSYKKAYMKMVLGNLTTHVKTMYQKGARKFAFQNLAPLGCQPHLKLTLGSHGSCENEVQEAIQMHNAAFSELLKKLARQLPGLRYTIYDLYSSAYQRILYGNKFGFKETGTACCGSGDFNGETSCGQKEKNFTVCDNPSEYLWFDAGHFTERANYQFSLQFWSGTPDLVAPYALKDLFHIH